MSDELRILMVLRAPVGGLFRHVADVTRGLSARGHRLGLVADSLSADAMSAERLEGLAPALALGLHKMPMPRLLGAGDFAAPLKIRRLAQRLGIGIVHGHGAKGGLYARLARASGRAALYTPHGGVLHFDPKSPAGAVFVAIERALAGRTDAFIFESGFARETYLERIARPEAPTPVIHNGLLAGEFEPVGTVPDADDFAFVGELRDLKGIFVLVDALAGVAAPSGRPATLVMAGDGPDRAALEARIEALGLGGRVRLVGAQPARSVFARGRVVCAPSLAESLPYVVLEAAAAGKPVIATRVGGVAEIFGPLAERLIPAGDVAALRDAMQAALTDPAAAKADAGTLYAFVRHEFSAEHMVDRIEALYRSLGTKSILQP